MADLFHGCELNGGSASAHDLRARVGRANRAGQRTLAYTGYTAASTVGARIKADGYRGNVLMRTLWDWQPPRTLIAFELAPAARAAGGSAAVVMLMEFLVTELLHAWGAGPNLQPGGPYNFA